MVVPPPESVVKRGNWPQDRESPPSWHEAEEAFLFALGCGAALAVIAFACGWILGAAVERRLQAAPPDARPSAVDLGEHPGDAEDGRQQDEERGLARVPGNATGFVRELAEAVHAGEPILRPMGTTIECTWDRRALDVLIKGRGVEAAIIRAVSKAGGDAIRAMKADSSRKVRERKRLKLSTVNKSLPIRFPTGKRDLHSMVWRMDVSGRPIPVAEFPHRQVRKGVSAEITKGRRKLIKGAFTATLRSGHAGVFRRRGKARLPIDEAFTTRVSDVFRDPGFIPQVHARTAAVLNAALARLLPVELAKLKQK